MHHMHAQAHTDTHSHTQIHTQKGKVTNSKFVFKEIPRSLHASSAKGCGQHTLRCRTQAVREYLLT